MSNKISWCADIYFEIICKSRFHVLWQDKLWKGWCIYISLAYVPRIDFKGTPSEVSISAALKIFSPKYWWSSLASKRVSADAQTKCCSRSIIFSGSIRSIYNEHNFQINTTRTSWLKCSSDDWMMTELDYLTIGDHNKLDILILCMEKRCRLFVAESITVTVNVSTHLHQSVNSYADSAHVLSVSMLMTPLMSNMVLLSHSESVCLTSR